MPNSSRLSAAEDAIIAVGRDWALKGEQEKALIGLRLRHAQPPLDPTLLALGETLLRWQPEPLAGKVTL
jgi:hypothetical protein